MATINNIQRILINNTLVKVKSNSVKYTQKEGSYKVVESQDGTDVEATAFFVPASKLATMTIELLLNENGQKVINRLMLDEEGVASVTITNDVCVYMLNPGSLTEPLSYEFTDEGTISFGLTGKLEIQRTLL